jgi:hypothetical protein
MLIIQHRVNTIAQLSATSPQYGIEADLRSEGSNLVLHHDPFVKGEDWTSWLQSWQHAFFIANIKTEGIEERVINDLEASGMGNYFLLDVSLPFIVKYMRKGFGKMAIRFSEYEPEQLALRFAGKLEWVWVDCFTRMPLNSDIYALLRPHFKLCLVSPELQGRATEEIAGLRTELASMPVDAVCTKHPALWQ